MPYLGTLTPEEAERDWGISRNGDLVITSGLSSKSKKSPGGKNPPSAGGSEKPESLAESAGSNSASPDPMLPAMNGLEDWLQEEVHNLKTTNNLHQATSQRGDSTIRPGNGKAYVPAAFCLLPPKRKTMS